MFRTCQNSKESPEQMGDFTRELIEQNSFEDDIATDIHTGRT